MTNRKPTTVLILGGGFAGLRTALRLGHRARPAECTVMLVDREKSHVNPVWLYEVATAFTPREREAVGTVIHETAAVPFERILAGSGVAFLQRSLEQIDPVTRTVRLDGGGHLAADILVVALGSTIATFGIPGVDVHAFSIKSLPEAVALRHHLVQQFLRFRSASAERQARAFRVVVVGGGSAGVELAAELALFLRKLAALHGVHPRLPTVELFEAGECILREYPPGLRARGHARLRVFGVRIRERESVCAVGPDHVACAGGLFLPTDTVVWLAGIKTHDLLVRSGFPAHPRGGVYVENTLEVRGLPRVFAAGDCVYAVDARTGRVAPDVAYAALQQGTVVAQNVLRRIRGQPLISYFDRPRPTLATVGGKFALAHIPPLQFSGRLGWFLKQLVDLRYLFSLLPNDVALRTWIRNVRVRVAND